MYTTHTIVLKQYTTRKRAQEYATLIENNISKYYPQSFPQFGVSLNEVEGLFEVEIGGTIPRNINLLLLESKG